MPKRVRFPERPQLPHTGTRARCGIAAQRIYPSNPELCAPIVLQALQRFPPRYFLVIHGALLGGIGIDVLSPDLDAPIAAAQLSTLLKSLAYTHAAHILGLCPLPIPITDQLR